MAAGHCDCVAGFWSASNIPHGRLSLVDCCVVLTGTDKHRAPPMLPHDIWIHLWMINSFDSLLNVPMFWFISEWSIVEFIAECLFISIHSRIVDGLIHLWMVYPFDSSLNVQMFGFISECSNVLIHFWMVDTFDSSLNDRSFWFIAECSNVLIHFWIIDSWIHCWMFVHINSF